MDFTGLDGYYFYYSEDAFTGLVTITITIQNLAQTVTVGTFVVEKSKAMSVFTSLAELGSEISSDIKIPLVVVPIDLSYGTISGAGVASDILNATPISGASILTDTVVGDIVAISNSGAYNGNYYIVEKISAQQVRLNVSFNADLNLKSKYTVTRSIWKGRRTTHYKNDKLGTTEFLII